MSDDYYENWLQERIAEIESLRSQTVTQCFILEMAFVENGKNGAPIFEHRDCPFLQASVVYLTLLGGKCTEILTYQNDDTFGLHLVTDDFISPPKYEHELADHSIFRVREIDEFPKGEISSVAIRLNTRRDVQHISEIELSIGGKKVLLKSGEVYENSDGSVYIFEHDEFVLVFLNPANKDRTVFGRT